MKRNKNTGANFGAILTLIIVSVSVAVVIKKYRE
ncbi:MAG: NPXTG-anchored protein [Oscillospiraceae bacterium]|nr:NPXTG-anchored protein [Oscillospiraceae bacterium]